MFWPQRSQAISPISLSVTFWLLNRKNYNFHGEAIFLWHERLWKSRLAATKNVNRTKEPDEEPSYRAQGCSERSLLLLFSKSTPLIRIIIGYAHIRLGTSAARPARDMIFLGLVSVRSKTSSKITSSAQLPSLFASSHSSVVYNTRSAFSCLMVEALCVDQGFKIRLLWQVFAAMIRTFAYSLLHKTIYLSSR